MISASEYEDLLRRRDEAKQEADQAEGAYQEIMKELRRKGCKTVDQAKALLKKLQRKKARLEAEEKELYDRANALLKRSGD